METFKNSYKVKEKEMVSLSVYNVGFQQCESGYQWGPGIRDHYLIHYVISGKGYYRVAGITYALHAGDVFLIYPNTEVTYYADSEEPWEYTWVGFSGSDAALILEATDFTPKHPILASCSYGDMIKEHLLRIYDVRGNNFSSSIEMSGELYLTLSLFVTNALKKKQTLSDLDYVNQAITYMESHFSYPITIDEVASSVGISRSHLFREFKRLLKKSPKEFLTEYRLRYSIYLLTSTDLSIQAIASSAGFDNGLYFSKVFHEWKGLPPSQYRETHKDK